MKGEPGEPGRILQSAAVGITPVAAGRHGAGPRIAFSVTMDDDAPASTEYR